MAPLTGIASTLTDRQDDSPSLDAPDGKAREKESPGLPAAAHVSPTAPWPASRASASPVRRPQDLALAGIIDLRSGPGALRAPDAFGAEAERVGILPTSRWTTSCRRPLWGLIPYRRLALSHGRPAQTRSAATDPRPLTAQQKRVTRDDVRQQIDALLDDYTNAQFAHVLNERGLRTGAVDAFDGHSVQWVRYAHKLRSLKQRLFDDGWRTGGQAQQQLGANRTTLGRWR